MPYLEFLKCQLLLLLTMFLRQHDFSHIVDRNLLVSYESPYAELRLCLCCFVALQGSDILIVLGYVITLLKFKS